MPELPEVETIRRDLERFILGRTISAIRVIDGRVVREMSSKSFVQSLQKKKVSSVTRRGKAIVVSFGPATHLIVQPMMTGQFIVFPEGNHSVIKQTKIEFLFQDGCAMVYNDQRLFGRLFVVRDLEDVKFFKAIGPEPFAEDFNLEWLAGRLKKHKSPIKTLLMNQNFLAGIGNIYASEILFRSGIDPQRRANTLKKDEVGKLFKAIPAVLKEAIQFRGTSMLTYRDASGEKGSFINRIKVYGRQEEQCYRCRTPILRIVQAGRSTFFCKVCQS